MKRFLVADLLCGAGGSSTGCALALDRIVPLADGGEHSARNAQSAHLRCNQRKHVGAGGQLRLFG